MLVNILVATAVFFIGLAATMYFLPKVKESLGDIAARGVDKKNSGNKVVLSTSEAKEYYALPLFVRFNVTPEDYKMSGQDSVRLAHRKIAGIASFAVFIVLTLTVYVSPLVGGIIVIVVGAGLLVVQSRAKEKNFDAITNVQITLTQLVPFLEYQSQTEVTDILQNSHEGLTNRTSVDLIRETVYASAYEGYIESGATPEVMDSFKYAMGEYKDMESIRLSKVSASAETMITGIHTAVVILSSMWVMIVPVGYNLYIAISQI